MSLDSRLLGALFVSLSLCACSPKVVIDFDKHADFGKYHAYAWSEGTPAKSPLVDARIVGAIDKQLAAKGYRKVEHDPDMLVSYHAATDEEIRYNTTSLGTGYGPGWGPGYGWYRGGYGWSGGVSTAMTTPSKVITGTLMVDIYDAAGKQMVWRGVGSDTVEADPGANETKIREVVERMFEKFPPPAQ